LVRAILFLICAMHFNTDLILRNMQQLARPDIMLLMKACLQVQQQQRATKVLDLTDFEVFFPIVSPRSVITHDYCDSPRLIDSHMAYAMYMYMCVYQNAT
jgi:hypothetical protein